MYFEWDYLEENNHFKIFRFFLNLDLYFISFLSHSLCFIWQAGCKNDKHFFFRRTQTVDSETRDQVNKLRFDWLFTLMFFKAFVDRLVSWFN